MYTHVYIYIYIVCSQVSSSVPCPPKLSRHRCSRGCAEIDWKNTVIINTQAGVAQL